MIKTYKKIVISLLFFILTIAYGQAPSTSIGAGCTKSNLMTPLFPGYANPLPDLRAYFLVEVQQNTVKSFSNNIYSYTISCPQSIDVHLISQFGAASLKKVDELWQDFKPSQVSTKVDIVVSPIGGTSGSVLRGTYDIVNKIISGGVSDTYTNPSFGKNTEILIQMYLHPFYFYSNINIGYRSWQLPPLDGYAEISSKGQIISTLVAYPAFYTTKDSCKINPYTTIVSPAVVDFGNISKNEIENGKVFSRSFTMDLTLKNKNCEGVTRSPKVFFIPQDNYNENDIYLDNGLMMTFKDNNKPIPMAKSYTLGQISNNKLNKTINVELKKSNRGGDIRPGPFSSTVIYLMEYL